MLQRSLNVYMPAHHLHRSLAFGSRIHSVGRYARPSYKNLNRKPFPTQIQQRWLNTGGLNNLFDRDTVSGIQIRNVAETGIEFEDGLTLSSSCIVVGGKVFLWKTPGPPWVGWTNDDFELFNVIIPKPEILLLGTGKHLLLPPPSIREHLHQIGIQLDIMDTKNAASTFNLLSEEGRRVAAALLPLVPSSWQ